MYYISEVAGGKVMSKAKYISLIILSTLLYIAWLVGLYFSLGLLTHSAGLNLPMFARRLSALSAHG